MIGLWHTEGLWDMRMLVDMHSRGATALRASTAEHAKVLGPDAAAAPPTVATFQLGSLLPGLRPCAPPLLRESARIKGDKAGVRKQRPHATVASPPSVRRPRQRAPPAAAAAAAAYALWHPSSGACTTHAPAASNLRAPTRPMARRPRRGTQRRTRHRRMTTVDGVEHK